MNEESFFSIDRLIEFGLGMGMAQQMIKIMNETMKSMYVPGSVGTIQTTTQSLPIYVAINGQSTGPYTEAEFSKLVGQGVVNKDTLVWQPGMLAWKPVESVPSVLKIVALTPPPLPVI